MMKIGCPQLYDTNQLGRPCGHEPIHTVVPEVSNLPLYKN